MSTRAGFRTSRIPRAIALGAALAAGLAAAAHAARAGDLRVAAKGSGIDVRRHVVAGGGGSSSGAAFAVTGTIGQPDADPLHPATGGAFAVSGGFWPGTAPAIPQPEPVFADGFEARMP